jgi:hypothetical protein
VGRMVLSLCFVLLFMNKYTRLMVHGFKGWMCTELELAGEQKVEIVR